jgi:membrane protease YdiL (CAAX protease family)
VGLAAVAPLYLLKVSSGQLGTAIFKLFLPAKQVTAMLASENDVIGVLFKTGPAYLDWLFGIMLVVVAPLAEEIFFRGFTCEVMRERLGSRGAIISSALLFAAVHLYLIQFIPVFVMGLGLAWLYEARRSLVPSFLAHATLNLIAVLLLLFGKG